MKNDITKQITALEQEWMESRKRNAESHAKVSLLEQHVLEYDEKLGKILTENTEALTAIRTKLLVEKRQKEELEIEYARLKAQVDKVVDENEKLRKETELRIIYDTLAMRRVEEEEKVDHENIEAKVKFLDELQREKAQLFLVTEKDPRLQILREDSEKLAKQAKEAEKRLDNTNYRVLEMETLQILSVKKKDEDQEVRKKLQAELDKWKDQLDDTVKANELKVERKLREAESAHIRELQAELLKERHELNELKTKLDNIYIKEREYIIEQANRNRQREDLIKKKEVNEAMNKQLCAAILELEPKVSETHTNVEALRIRVSDAREERGKLQVKLSEVEEANILLISQLKFLEKNNKLEEDLKKINLDDLNQVMQTNKNVNQTILAFMNKYEKVKEDFLSADPNALQGNISPTK